MYEATVAVEPIFDEASRRGARVGDRADPWIVGSAGLLVLLGVIFVFDTSYFYAAYNYGSGFRMIGKHLFSVAVGLGLLAICSRTGSAWFQAKAPWLMGFAALTLAATLIPGIGVSVNGAKRWISLGFFNYQPAEFAKLAFVIFVSAYLTRMADRVTSLRYGMIPVMVLMGSLGAMLLGQPDFGTSAVIGILGTSLLLLAGVRLWQVGAIGVLGVTAAGLLVWLEPYRWARLMVFLNPGADPQGTGWQLRQALIAFGSGQLSGLGLGASTQKSGWLPEAHTDFIFSVIGEETGLLGGACVLLIFCVLAVRGFRVAHRHEEPFGQLLAAGITLMLVVQALINMGVVLGLLPTKGIGLPFISYGGSSMMMFLAAVGILMSLSRELRER
jgi:cell division protein FtsW